MRKFFWVLGLIVIFSLAILLYFYKLGSIPSGFYVDEASVAYNAISILKTGKDEYGFSFPLAFRLMGSYSPPLFIYLSSLVAKFFGSSIIVFRSIIAVCSLLSIYIFLRLAKGMNLYRFEFSYFVITLFYSIAPWTVFNARLGYETTFGFLLFNIGALFLFRALEKPKNLIFGTLFLSISTFASYNQRFLAPLLLITYLLCFGKNLFAKNNTRALLISILIGVVTQIPNLLIITTPAFWTKGAQFNINYFWMVLTYLSPRTLFYLNPDIDLQHTIPTVSMMFNWMVIPYFIGAYLMIRRCKEIRYKFLVFYFVVSIAPSIFSSQFVSEQRVLPFIIPLSLVIGLGIDEVYSHLRKYLRYAVTLVLLLYSLLTVYVSYFVLFPKERANGWDFGYDKVAEFIKEKPNQKFVIDDSRNPRLYILLLYFLKIPPEDYQKNVSPDYRNNYYQNPPVANHFELANIKVKAIDWRTDPISSQYIIGDSLAISESQMREHGLFLVEEIKDPLENIIFKIYKTRTR